MKFKLTYLFCLILIVGVALMWWKWSNSSELTANRLLFEKKQADEQIENGDYLFTKFTIPFRHDKEHVDRLDEWSIKYLLAYDDYDWQGIVIQKVDWPAIEARAAEENWAFYRQVIITALAAIALGWAVWPKGKQSQSIGIAENPSQDNED